MDWLQAKYVGLLSPRLDQYRQRGASFNFRCPICGDSEKNKTKARGYIYEYKGNLKYHCHNCGADMSVDQFIKEIDPGLFEEYILEKAIERRVGSAKFEDIAPKKYRCDSLKELRTLEQLPSHHPCVQLVAKRKIPQKFYSKLYYSPKFMEWVNTIIPDKFEKLAHDTGRLVIPFLDKNGNMHAFQGRAIEDIENRLRYIMIVTDESIPSLYGMDAVNLNKRFYVFEGPIDSMFIPNAIAAGGGDFHTRLSHLNREYGVLVFDNEPYSFDTKKRMIKALKAGFQVCIWPERMIEKDVNNMILAGDSAEYIKAIIDENVHSGMLGEMAVAQWSKA